MDVNRLREKFRFYRFDPKGPETWIEDHIRVFITDVLTGQQSWVSVGKLPDTPHPVTGRSYKQMWERQKLEIIRPAMSRDEHGHLKYHTVILCVPRGEGKSFVNCMLMLYRFFVFPKQLIVLGSNSRDQSKFSLYDIMRDMCLNSPQLLHILGDKGVREKSIILTDRQGNTVSSIATVSTFTGILSNITACAFSEFFLSEPSGKFFTQLDSSRRNIPDSQSFIDSTVSTRDHMLYRMYEAATSGKDPGIFFYYRDSEGRQEDFSHPMMTQAQLDSFRVKFLPSEFERFFLNKWSGDIGKFFTRPMIEAMRWLSEPSHADLMRKVTTLHKLKQSELPREAEIRGIMSELQPLPYSLSDNGHPRDADQIDLSVLSDKYDTHFALGVGIDMSDALKDDLTAGARTIVTLIAKGLIGSRSNPTLWQGVDKSKLNFIYFVLSLRHIEDAELTSVIWRIERYLDSFNFIYSICGERYGLAGLRAWAVERDQNIELIAPTKGVQKASFNMLYQSVSTGRFKVPELAVPGYVEDDVFREELKVFQYDSSKTWYGSPYKDSANKQQDDTVFATALGMYGLRDAGPDDFVDFSNTFMGTVIQPDDLVGIY